MSNGDRRHPHAYDKAKWHLGSRWTVGMPESQAFVHEGLVLAWMIERGLMDPTYVTDHAEIIARLQRREKTPGEHFAQFGGALVDDMFNEEGNAFLREYYDPRTGTGQFFDDYVAALSPPNGDCYAVHDSWQSYVPVAQLLDRRFAEWRSRRIAQKPRR